MLKALALRLEKRRFTGTRRELSISGTERSNRANFNCFVFSLQERDIELEMGDDYILDLQSKG